MSDYPDLCNDEPSCQKPELLKRIEELEAHRDRLMRRLDNLCDEWELIEAPLCIKAYKRCIRELRALLEDGDE